MATRESESEQARSSTSLIRTTHGSAEARENAHGLIRQYLPKGKEHGGALSAALQLDSSEVELASQKAFGVQNTIGMLQRIFNQC